METRTCQNCKIEFRIEMEDFAFYEKMQVPPPTFCPECRFQRRIMFRNEYNLYQRKCNLCNKDIITVYSPDKSYKVYCNPCWWSDKWDALEYGIDYDPSRNFFEQFKDLRAKVPYMALVVDYPTLVNSDYINHAGNAKDCYLIFNTDFCENVHYSSMTVSDKDSMDSYRLENSQLCYEVINGIRLYKTFFSEDCHDCHNVYFSKNLSGCSDCFGCVNLKNKRYHIWNEPYTKEAYEQKISELKLDSYATTEDLKKRAREFWEQFPHKFMHERHNVNVSGDYIEESRNAHFMYMARYVENGKFCQLITMKPVKDVYDYTEWGNNAQRVYEGEAVGEYVDNIKFSYCVWRANCLNVEYSFYALSSSDIFGCVGVRNKQYCILNKQYTKGEYQKMKARIIEDMNKKPYIDSKGRIFRYGEFFPYDLALFDYNETTAMNYFPLDKAVVESKGWRWRSEDPSQHKPTLSLSDIPDSIREVKNSIIEEILECASCNRAFRITERELNLLKRFGLPLPRRCWKCRYKERFGRVNPPRLWSRACAKCGKTIETSYAPNRPEIVYCGSCYQQEVI